jgi:putative membrane protein
VLAGCTAALVLYLTAVARERRRGRPWPAHRSALWAAGLAAAGSGFVGPLAEQARSDFAAHMAAHLVVGMAAPILLVVARPLTLALRGLGVHRARLLTRTLKSMPSRFISHPVTAGMLATGSLWFLYATPMAAVLHSRQGHSVLQLHFLLAGWLFTAAVVGRDPNPHRAGTTLRTVVLILALAGHSTLAKWIYLNPPPGVPAEEAEAGAYLMYYGGTLADIALITVFCAQWYAARKPAAEQAEPAGPVSSRGCGGAAAAIRPERGRSARRRSRRIPPGATRR